jgi:hypothetical protein
MVKTLIQNGAVASSPATQPTRRWSFDGDGPIIENHDASIILWCMRFGIVNLLSVALSATNAPKGLV